MRTKAVAGSKAESPVPKANGRGGRTLQQAELLLALQAVRSGDFSVRLPGDRTGIDGKIADTFNEIVVANARMAAELKRVGHVVGKKGQTSQRVRFEPLGGEWGETEDSINALIDDLLWPTTEVTRAVSAVAQGDLLRTVPLEVDGRPLEGEFLRSASIVNTMIQQLVVFTSEVTRVAREVGTDGKLGGQAEVREVSGVWKDLTENVNLMASNLTAQVRNIAEVVIAVASGDLSKKITVDVRGEILQLKEAINTMVDQLRSFASEVTRVAREVGTEGRLGGQALVPGVAGTWKDLTDSVNAMCGNLTAQVRNIADVTTAVARGDLSRKITVGVKGEILELKNTINTLVDQLNAFFSEVTRVAREVGTDGKLGGQAQVREVRGVWKDLTENVNLMASNLTAQVRNIADVTIAVASGDLSKKITADVRGEILQLKEAINTMVDQLRSFASEVTRVAREVGTEGKLGGQAQVPGVAGTWKDLTDNVNFMASNLTAQVRNIAEVSTAIADGDLSRKITVNVSGEILQLKESINTMVDQLNAFAGEVTRVAREVGTDGRLGGQANVRGVAGTWKDLTDSVNSMANNLTAQVRNIAEVATAIANGDLSRKITVNVSGEILQLKETINTMVDQLNGFAGEVTRVAREVGTEGRLGGQANVPGVAGTWKDLTGNVNLLAANLTTQVRAIAEVATAVTRGDLTRSIKVDARGEVAELKDNLNTMITNLRLTTEQNSQQDWLKTNLARVTGLLQGQRDLSTVGRMLLSELAPLVTAQRGVIYLMDSESSEPGLNLLAGYAADGREPSPPQPGASSGNGANRTYERLQMGEGLLGQCAAERQRMLITDVPATTVPVRSGLFESVPRNVVVLPVLFESQVKAVIELASLSTFTASHLAFLDQLTASIGILLNSIEATMKTEGLLKQSQQLASELQSQQTELQEKNEQLAQKAQQLAEQNAEVERKNQEIEQARRALEEKADELALTSKYKSEFLANMSHELRTPLNSILILGQQLTDNPDGNLTPRQIEFARTIHSAGTDLLNLISDILDLSKIESGTVTVDAEEIQLGHLLETVERTFRHEAENRHLTFDLFLDSKLSRTMTTDSKRLMQVLKNLLSNAFKFTEAGGVRLSATAVGGGWNPNHAVLQHAEAVVAFEVADTGIGIPLEKQKIIFEAFQQADASTSRKYGGTGLGLAISRELAYLLGGEIQLRSTPKLGSTFTLYLPVNYVGPSVAVRGTPREEWQAGALR
jgi:signal transduction histidine kinase/HAMP domain-containing protein